MTDSMDEWDGGAIDGRDQYLADAPYWNGDGETVDGTDPNATGEVTTENVPDPGDEPETDDTDESETDDPEVPTWPPNPETLTELRRRLLNGASTESLADGWSVASNGAIYTAATGETYTDVDADIPPLRTVGEAQYTKWVMDEDGETQSELTDNGEFKSETETSANDRPVVEDNKDLREWPPDSDTLTEIRQRLIDGETAEHIASEFPVHQGTINRVAQGIRHADIDAEIGPVEVKSGTKSPTWGEVDSDEQTELTNPDADDTDGSEVPTWPPNPETLTKLRRRLLNGATAHDVGEWIGVTDDTIRYAAKGERHSGVDADVPPLTVDGNGAQAVWAVDETEAEAEPETETTDNDDSEPEIEMPGNGKWPEPDQQESGLVSADERPVARDPPEPETPTVPTRWIVVGVGFVVGWILSRLVRGGGDE